MALETGTYISDLVATNPVGATDLKSAGDDHIRFIKSTLLATFPYVTGEVSLTHTQLNNAVYLTGSAANYMVFYQAAAPTGWTQLTALSNMDGAAMRVESGTGGGAVSGTYDIASPPSTAHTHSVSGTSGATTLTAAQSGLPSHSHTYTRYSSLGTRLSGGASSVWWNSESTQATSTTGGTSATEGHTHTFSATSGAASSSPKFEIKYLNVIICSKN